VRADRPTEAPTLIQAANKFVQFAIDVLVADGLHVAPFDQHPTGDRRLTVAGLSSEEWLRWIGAFTSTLGREDREFWAVGDANRYAERRFMEWPGPQPVASVMADAWARYEHEPGPRPLPAGDIPPVPRTNHLRRPLTIYLVSYPWRADAILRVDEGCAIAAADAVPPSAAVRNRIQMALGA
jgi:hypothetical protein